jgi:TIR domain
VRKVFISYARQNKPDVEQLAEHLRVLGCEIWHDSSLHGGQDWWNEILRQIATCDTFIAIISREALNSTACRREFDWAHSLEKPVLPVAVEPPPKALPRRFSERQIVDYSDPAARDRAALLLAGGLATLSAAPPLPDPLPEPPAAPLSYLTDLIDLVAERKPLDHDQQRHILNHLEPALHSIDPEERRGGRDILETLSSRDDLYADVYRTINRLQDMVEPGRRAATKPSAVGQRVRQLFLSPVGPRGRRYHPKIVASAAVVALVTVIAVVAVATHNRGNTQQLSHDRASGQHPYQAYVLAPKPGLTGANVYAAANTSSPRVGNLPVGKTVFIDCVSKGDPVEGPGVQGQPPQSTDLWDRIRPEGDNSDLGFMPDAWVNTNGTAPVAPNC